MFVEIDSTSNNYTFFFRLRIFSNILADEPFSVPNVLCLLCADCATLAIHNSVVGALPNNLLFKLMVSVFDTSGKAIVLINVFFGN